jgi:phosphoglycerate dehydrogenase-like enzyme
MGSTLGIVGLGRIGRAVATRAVGLGMNVIAFEPYPNKEFVETWRIGLTDLDDLFSRADYVSLHCPASAENRHLINANSLAKMKAGAVLINTARGGLVDEQALYDALKSGQLRGAGLDVFEVEPLPLGSPLLQLDNILLAGHVAGLDTESHRDTFIMCAETIIDLYKGGWPAECIQNLKGVSNWKWQRG